MTTTAQKYKYLKHFPEPFLDDIVLGRCVPFIGAGFSLNAELPEGREMPDWTVLGRGIAESLQDYDYVSPIDALSTYEHEFTRVKLVEKLHDALHIGIAAPGLAHTEFVRLPFDMVVTTNIDFLLDQAYDACKRHYTPLLTEDQLSTYASQSALALLKLHGDLNHPSRLVITENDYDLFLEKNPLLATYLANVFIGKTALFVGYSLDDPDFRQLWQVVRERLGDMRRPAYALLVGAEQRTVQRFERRGLKVINLPGKSANYGDILQMTFTELHDYWTTNLVRESLSTEDDAQAEMLLPRDALNRLCYFSVPANAASFYRDVVFPVCESFGFTPTLALDVISPGQNTLAKVHALMENARLVVADFGSEWTSIEIGSLLARTTEDNVSPILFVLEEGSRAPHFASSFQYAIRPKAYQTDESDKLGFHNHVENWFREFSLSLANDYRREPSRLLEKREYRASLIAVTSLLENTLREKLRPLLIEKNLGRHKLGPDWGLRGLVENAILVNVLEKSELPFLVELITLRNSVVHSGINVHGRTAKRFVNRVMKILDDIET